LAAASFRSPFRAFNPQIISSASLTLVRSNVPCKRPGPNEILRKPRAKAQWNLHRCKLYGPIPWELSQISEKARPGRCTVVAVRSVVRYFDIWVASGGGAIMRTWSRVQPRPLPILGA
jgi:hypothetical protein